MLSVVLNGILGFSMILGVLFCIGDIDSALSTSTGYPFMEIFLQATNSVAGSAAMAAIITVLALCATVGLLASTSRMFWSFSRDRGLPGWRTLQTVFSTTQPSKSRSTNNLLQVNVRTSVPIWSVAATTVISCLLALINIGSVTAFNNIVSLAVVGLFTSYLLASGLLLYRRCTNTIKLSSESPIDLVNAPNAPLVWGPWRFRGFFGIVNNTFTCIYLTVILLFSLWPPATPVDAAIMNYSSLMLGAVLIFSVAYYVLYARKEFQGPVLETQRPNFSDST